MTSVVSILERFRLPERAAVVTGAGRGIGAATAVALAQAGADVVISARTASQLDEVGNEIEKAGRRAVPVPADLSDLENVARLAAVARLHRRPEQVGTTEGGDPIVVIESEPLVMTSTAEGQEFHRLIICANCGCEFVWPSTVRHPSQLHRRSPLLCDRCAALPTQ